MHAAVGAPRGLGVLRVGRTGALALRLHAASEALEVHHNAARLGNLLGHLDRKAVRVVQGERLLAGQHVAFERVERLFQERLALPQRGAEAFLFGQDDAARELAVLHDFGIDVAHEAHDLVHVPVQERALDADEVRLHDRTAQQAAQHIAAPLVGRQDAVGDHERDAAAVIGDDAQGQVAGRIGAVGNAAQALAHRHQAAQHIGLVVGLDALHDGRDALEAHAGVDVLLRQRRERCRPPARRTA